MNVAPYIFWCKFPMILPYCLKLTYKCFLSIYLITTKNGQTCFDALVVISAGVLKKMNQTNPQSHFLAKPNRFWVCRRKSLTAINKHKRQIAARICQHCVCQLPPSPPVYGLINKTASAAPFGSPARVPIILWSNINVWYWACSLIQSQLILSVNYLQILRCGGRSPRTALARFRIPNWLPLLHPPHLHSCISSSDPPPLLSFLFGLSASFKA